MLRNKEESEALKAKIIERNSAGVGARVIGEELGVSKEYAREVVKDIPGAIVNKPAAPLDLPALDPTKPLGPQYEAIGAAILVEAARKGEISTKQIQASSQLVRMGQREKAQPAGDRELEIILDEIDVLEDDKFHQIGEYHYEVKA
jgi:hypothetical protein